MKKIYTILFVSVMFTMSANAAGKLLVIGDAVWCGWNIQNAAVMTTTDGNVFHYTGWLNAGADFKFLTENDWGNPEYRNGGEEYLGASGTLVLGQGDEGDVKFKVATAGNYHIVCDLTNLTITAELAGEQTNHILHNVLYLIGDATTAAWDLSNAPALAQDAENPFLFSGVFELNSAGSFKIAVNKYGNYDQRMYHPSADDNTTITDDGTDDRKWTVAESGDYTVTVDLLAATISIAPYQETAMPEVKDNGKVIRTEYFTVQGQKISGLQQNAVTIIRKIYESGKMETKKEVKKS
ncbi:MAG: SusF/SusE family outer membrane protein [Dysgonamonadaceae bacterium]|jgi:hypothetical protein|nr:SusF/SusE family outer membrane protein [Dysgonamonadaceae bacterium]